MKVLLVIFHQSGGDFINTNIFSTKKFTQTDRCIAVGMSRAEPFLVIEVFHFPIDVFAKQLSLPLLAEFVLSGLSLAGFRPTRLKIIRKALKLSLLRGVG